MARESVSEKRTVRAESLWLHAQCDWASVVMLGMGMELSVDVVPTATHVDRVQQAVVK